MDQGGIGQATMKKNLAILLPWWFPKTYLIQKISAVSFDRRGVSVGDFDTIKGILRSTKYEEAGKNRGCRSF